MSNVTRWEDIPRKPAPELKSGGDDGTSDDMEARVKRLEDDFKEVRTDLKAIRGDLSEIKGKLSNTPATWQIITICGTMLALTIAAGAATITIVRLTAGG